MISHAAATSNGEATYGRYRWRRKQQTPRARGVRVVQVRVRLAGRLAVSRVGAMGFGWPEPALHRPLCDEGAARRERRRAVAPRRRRSACGTSEDAHSPGLARPREPVLSRICCWVSAVSATLTRTRSSAGRALLTGLTTGRLAQPVKRGAPATRAHRRALAPRALVALAAIRTHTRPRAVRRAGRLSRTVRERRILENSVLRSRTQRQRCRMTIEAVSPRSRRRVSSSSGRLVRLTLAGRTAQRARMSRVRTRVRRSSSRAACVSTRRSFRRTCGRPRRREVNSPARTWRRASGRSRRPERDRASSSRRPCSNNVRSTATRIRRSRSAREPGSTRFALSAGVRQVAMRSRNASARWGSERRSGFLEPDRL